LVSVLRQENGSSEERFTTITLMQKSVVMLCQFYGFVEFC
jgi:hypothetical protein